MIPRGLAALLGAVVAERLAWSWHLPAYLFLAGLTIPLVASDLSGHRLPNRLTLTAYPVMGAALLGAALVEQRGSNLVRALVAGGVVLVVYGALHAIRPTGLGAGDVKLAGVLGMALGWFSWDAVSYGIAAGFLIGAATGLATLVRRRKPDAGFAFGPAMLIGAWTAILATGG